MKNYPLITENIKPHTHTHTNLIGGGSISGNSRRQRCKECLSELCVLWYELHLSSLILVKTGKTNAIYMNTESTATAVPLQQSSVIIFQRINKYME